MQVIIDYLLFKKNKKPQETKHFIIIFITFVTIIFIDTKIYNL